jgi:hypothetical protein
MNDYEQPAPNDYEQPAPYEPPRCDNEVILRMSAALYHTLLTELYFASSVSTYGHSKENALTLYTELLKQGGANIA